MSNPLLFLRSDGAQNPHNGHVSMSFPTPGMQILSACIHFFGVSVLAHCLSSRVAFENFSSRSAFAQLSFARLLILLIFADSWLFLFVGGVLIFGAGLETNMTVCSLGIWLCIVFYASSKALIYAFLIEKVHVVWTPIASHRRLHSPVYIGCWAAMAGYVVIIVLLFVGRISYFREDGSCIIGLHHIATIPLVSYDLFINVLLTVLFLWPLFQSRTPNPVVRRVALRTLLAASVSLMTSAANMLVLTMEHGRELGWVCLGSCGADVIANALALFWVSSRTRPGATVGASATALGVKSVGRQSMAPGTMTKQRSTTPAPVVVATGASGTSRASTLIGGDINAEKLSAPSTPTSPAPTYTAAYAPADSASAAVGPVSSPLSTPTPVAASGQVTPPVRWSVISAEARVERQQRGGLARLASLFREPEAEVGESAHATVVLSAGGVCEGEVEDEDMVDDRHMTETSRGAGAV